MFNHGRPAALHTEASRVLPLLMQQSASNEVRNSLKWKKKVGFRSGLDAGATDILSFQIKAKGCDQSCTGSWKI